MGEPVPRMTKEAPHEVLPSGLLKPLPGVRTPANVLYMTTNWTHTATLATTYTYGPKQFGRTVTAGTTVTLLQDPAQQEGNLITFRFNGCTGVARLTDLRNIEAK